MWATTGRHHQRMVLRRERALSSSSELSKDRLRNRQGAWSGLTTERILKRKRQHLVEQRRDPGLDRMIRALQAERAQRTGRWERHARLNLDRRIAELRDLEARIRGGEEVKRFDAVVDRYRKRIHDIERHMSTEERRLRRASRKRKREEAQHRATKKTTVIAASRIRVQNAVRETPQRRATYHCDALEEELLQEIVQKPPPLFALCGDVCDTCRVPLRILGSESLFICPQCHVARVYTQSTSSRIQYGEEVEMSAFSYKRLNHFKDWVLNVQAKEATVISEKVLLTVMTELYNRRIRDLDKIDRHIVRQILKEHRLRRWYEHVPIIVAKITGLYPYRLTPHQQAQIFLMFGAIQAPYERHAPPTRRNFLSYSYVLYKLSQLCGYDFICNQLSLLKGADKLRAMDRIFQKICAEPSLDWQFIPSL